VDRGKQGTKRSTAVDARGIPLGTVTAPANRHDSPLLAETLDAVAETLGGLPEEASVHLERGYDSKATRERLEERGLCSRRSPGRASRHRSGPLIGG
jgi:IS5 family transposase